MRVSNQKKNLEESEIIRENSRETGQIPRE